MQLSGKVQESVIGLKKQGMAGKDCAPSLYTFLEFFTKGENLVIINEERTFRKEGDGCPLALRGEKGLDVE